MNPIAPTLDAALAALTVVPRLSRTFQSLSDDELLDAARTTAAIERLASTLAAMIAGDVARRSAHDLGHAGLAQRSGFRTPQELVRATAGTTVRAAAEAVQVGALMHDSAGASPSQPWLSVVSAGLLDGAVSVAAASAIRAGLGQPSAHVPADVLATAVGELCELGTTHPSGSPALDPDRLYRRARELRDELDEAGIADRETARREQRSLRFTKQSDGMSTLIWRLDPESAAVCGELYDRATSPRRGGPRFMNPDDLALTESLSADTRTTEQLASDVFLELLRHGADADSTQLLGTGAPVVRAVVRAGEPDATGAVTHGWIEGQTDPVSIETIDRLACAGSVQHVSLGPTGQPLDLGREQRLYSRRQRIALAIRDGGCRWPGCDRPPSWTEAHHLQHWARDHGSTDLDNGILLCRYHHLLLHNNQWQISLDGGDYWLIPPPSVNPAQRRRIMPSKSPVVRELLRTGARELAPVG